MRPPFDRHRVCHAYGLPPPNKRVQRNRPPKYTESGIRRNDWFDVRRLLGNRDGGALASRWCRGFWCRRLAVVECRPRHDPRYWYEVCRLPPIWFWGYSDAQRRTHVGATPRASFEAVRFRQAVRTNGLPLKHAEIRHRDGLDHRRRKQTTGRPVEPTWDRRGVCILSSRDRAGRDLGTPSLLQPAHRRRHASYIRCSSGENPVSSRPN